MAAGMGSRFGGLKQLEPVGPNGEFIIDYSVYDAIRAGFSKVVFIIKEENYKIFKETIGGRIEDKIRVEYVFQDIKDLPVGYECPKGREKPWGTAHAILAAKDIINEPFGIINADDFYGFDAYKKLAEFLSKNKTFNKYAMVGYKMANTLSKHGSVKRGVCEIKEGRLNNIIECNVEGMNASPLDGRDSFVLNDETIASMNMFGFMPLIFSYLESEIVKFLLYNKEDLRTCEFLIPEVVEKGIKENIFAMEVLKTDAIWYGITYKEDKSRVVKAINEYIKQGVYPKDLWR